MDATTEELISKLQHLRIDPENGHAIEVLAMALCGVIEMIDLAVVALEALGTRIDVLELKQALREGGEP